MTEFRTRVKLYGTNNFFCGAIKTGIPLIMTGLMGGSSQFTN